MSMPESSKDLSPLNLLIISPFTLLFSDSVKSISVPKSCANTPPLSISPTSSTGASTISASPILTISFSRKLISAGLPAPSITIISTSFSSLRNDFLISGISFFLYAKYSLALIFPSTSPFTITCEPVWLIGFNKIGFIQTNGVICAASACITCALPISSPSLVIKELSAMFCDLKGATLYPSRFIILQSPATKKLFPAPDIVP